MLKQAAHLLNAVVPTLPHRHDVLSFPFERSLLAATNPKELRAAALINYGLTARCFRHRAAESGMVGETHVGASTYRNRSRLHSHLHLQVCVFDGVFVERDDEALRFFPARALSKDELCELMDRLAVREARWMRKHGGARDGQGSDSNEARVFVFDEMLAQGTAWARDLREGERLSQRRTGEQR